MVRFRLTCRNEKGPVRGLVVSEASIYVARYCSDTARNRTAIYIAANRLHGAGYIAALNVTACCSDSTDSAVNSNTTARSAERFNIANDLHTDRPYQLPVLCYTVYDNPITVDANVATRELTPVDCYFSVSH